MEYEKVKNALALIANGRKTLQNKTLIDRISKKANVTKLETSMVLEKLLSEKLIECDWSNGQPISQVIVNLPLPEKVQIKINWQAEIAKQSFPGITKRLESRPVLLKGRSHADVISAFARLPEFAGNDIFLREVSSRLFWGNSKVLDSKEPLIAELLGLDSCPFPEKPLSIIAHVPSNNVKGILFIENEISFLAACKGRIKSCGDLILIFASGYKSGTSRIRRKSSTSVFYSSNSITTGNSIHLFDEWLSGADEKLPSYFWGDLDFSGMGILASLKNVFPLIEPWEPGYQPMLETIINDGGHHPIEAGKEKQEDPKLTGCEYADKILLPALRLHKRFLDQE